MTNRFWDIGEREEHFYWYWDCNGFKLSFNWCFSFKPDRKWISHKKGWIQKLKDVGKTFLTFTNILLRLKMTSRGRHMTGILTWECCRVGLEAAWECLWGEKKQLTCNSEDISLDLSGDVHATSPLGVVRPTQAGHVSHAALMDVHHTVWRQRQRDRPRPFTLCLLHDPESVRQEHIRSHLMPWCMRP